MPLLQAFVLCFRLHFGKDTITINTAAATVRQLFTSVFERVVFEDGNTAAGKILIKITQQFDAL